MAKQIKTDVTVEEYEFVDANGKHLFTISFHPTDVGIVKRYEKVADYLNNLSAKDPGCRRALLQEGRAADAAHQRRRPGAGQAGRDGEPGRDRRDGGGAGRADEPDVQFRYRNSDFCSHEPVHAAGIRKTVCGRDHGKDRGAD